MFHLPFQRSRIKVLDNIFSTRFIKFHMLLPIDEHHAAIKSSRPHLRDENNTRKQYQNPSPTRHPTTRWSKKHIQPFPKAPLVTRRPEASIYHSIPTKRLKRTLAAPRAPHSHPSLVAHTRARAHAHPLSVSDTPVAASHASARLARALAAPLSPGIFFFFSVQTLSRRGGGTGSDIGDVYQADEIRACAGWRRGRMY